MFEDEVRESTTEISRQKNASDSPKPKSSSGKRHKFVMPLCVYVLPVVLFVLSVFIFIFVLLKTDYLYINSISAILFFTSIGLIILGSLYIFALSIVLIVYVAKRNRRSFKSDMKTSKKIGVVLGSIFLSIFLIVFNVVISGICDGILLPQVKYLNFFYRSHGKQVEYYKQNDGTLAICIYDIDEEEFTIPEKFHGKKITEVSECVSSTLRKVTIPSSITKIKNGAFAKCSKLKSIVVDEGNPVYHSQNNCIIATESKTLISGCATSVIPGDGSVVSIASSAFAYCVGLQSVTIPESITSCGSLSFKGCSNLETLYWNAISCANMEFVYDIFAECPNLKTLVFGENVRYIVNDIVKSWDNIETIYWNAKAFPDENVDSLILRRSCPLLTTVIVGGNVKSIPAELFSACTQISNVVLGNSVESIGRGAFSGCRNIVSITLPQSLTVIEDDAFFGCLTLVEICNNSSLDISIGSKDNGRIGEFALNVYSDTSGQSYLEVVNDYLFYSDGQQNVLVTYTGETTDIVLPQNYHGESYVINKNAFYYNESLTSVVIPEGVTDIGRGAFQGCTSLHSVKIDAQIQVLRDYMFFGCSSLASITLPQSLTTIGSSVFYGCSFSSLIIPKNVVYISAGMISNCFSLENIILENPEGWSAGGVALSAEDLQDGTKVCYYFLNTYRNVVWTRST